MDEQNVVPRIRRALSALSHRAHLGYGAFLNHAFLHFSDPEELQHKATAAIAVCLGSMEQASLPAAAVHHGRSKQSELLAEEIRQCVDRDELEEVVRLATHFPGGFAMVVPLPRGIICLRDPLGIKPLFHGSMGALVGVGSEPRALDSAGCSHIRAMEPGSIVRMGPDFETIGKLHRFPAKTIDESEPESAAQRTAELLDQAVAHTLPDNEPIAVGFSGGLDSSLVAYLASRRTRVTLISISARGAENLRALEQAADILDLTYEPVDATTEDVRRLLASDTHVLEQKSPMDLTISVALHLVARKAWELGLRGLALGQLADELFGGYHKYLVTFRSLGAGKAQEMMRTDVVQSGAGNFERDERATSPYVDLILPYADLALVDYVLTVPAKFKIDVVTGERKTLLRKAARELGLPDPLCQKPKKALQYSTGISKIIRKALL